MKLIFVKGLNFSSLKKNMCIGNVAGPRQIPKYSTE